VYSAGSAVGLIGTCRVAAAHCVRLRLSERDKPGIAVHVAFVPTIRFSAVCRQYAITSSAFAEKKPVAAQLADGFLLDDSVVPDFLLPFLGFQFPRWSWGSACAASAITLRDDDRELSGSSLVE